MNNTIRINNITMIDCSNGRAVIKVEIDGTDHFRVRTFDAEGRVLDAGFCISQKDFGQIYIDPRGKLKVT